MISKRWKRRNRHINSELVKAVIEHSKWPNFKLVGRHPITNMYLFIDIRCLGSDSYRKHLKDSYKEQMFLRLLEKDIVENKGNLKFISQELIDKIKYLFKDEDINIEDEINDEE